MNRRHFLKSLGAGMAVVVWPSVLHAQQSAKAQSGRLVLPDQLTDQQKQQCRRAFDETVEAFNRPEATISATLISQHMTTVCRNCAGLLSFEPAADAFVVCMLAVVHDIGYAMAKREQHEKAGVPLARTVMERNGVDAAVIGKICDMVAVHDQAKIMAAWPEGRVLVMAHKGIGNKNCVAPATQEEYDARSVEVFASIKAR